MKPLRERLDLAQEVSSLSKDPSTKVGCVLVGKNNNIISTGFNKFPKGVDYTKERLDVKQEKYRFVIHAEESALLNALKQGSQVKGATAYVTHSPCNHCQALMAEAGVETVVTNKGSDFWKDRNPDAYRVSEEIRNESNIKYIEVC